MRTRIAIAIGIAGVLLLAAVGLHFLPRPLSTPQEQCRGSAAPSACRALVRIGGAPADLARPQDLATSDLRLPPLMAALREGRAALAAGQPVTAYKRCGEAGAAESADRVQAIVCQGHGALALGWPQRAAFLAQRALELQDDVGAHLLLGEALEAQGDRRGARLEFLRALDLEPDNARAAAGLRRVGGTPPPDLSGEERNREVAYALAAR